jgi:RNA polymerase sigma-70 factor (ECF subfamily)
MSDLSERFRRGGKHPNPETDRRLRTVEQAIKEIDSLLIGWLAKKFGDSSTARDIAQDAYLRVWRFAHEAPVDDARALIFKAAANLAANEFKARRRFRANHVEGPAASSEAHVETVPTDAPSPERAECARQDWEVCRKAIASLPEKARRAFVLSRFEELTYREIAERLRVSESSVEKYIILALKTLRESTEARDRAILQFPGRAARPTIIRGRTKKDPVRAR